MALRAVDQPEFSGRLGYLLRRFRVKAKDLSDAIGKPPGYVSWLMTDAKHVPTEMIVPIAEALSEASGANAVEIGKYLIGLSSHLDDGAMGGNHGGTFVLTDLSPAA